MRLLRDGIECDINAANGGVLLHKGFASAFRIVEFLTSGSDDGIVRQHTSLGCIDIEFVKFLGNPCSQSKNLRETTILKMPLCMLYEVKSGRERKNQSDDKTTSSCFHPVHGMVSWSRRYNATRLPTILTGGRTNHLRSS